MSRRDIERAVRECILAVAPEADLESLASDQDLRDELDLDSMDFLNIVTAVHERLQVAIPEADYPEIATLASFVAYVADRAGDRGAAG